MEITCEISAGQQIETRTSIHNRKTCLITTEGEKDISDVGDLHKVTNMIKDVVILS